jgi:hypothetical protein
MDVELGSEYRALTALYYELLKQNRRSKMAETNQKQKQGNDTVWYNALWIRRITPKIAVVETPGVNGRSETIGIVNLESIRRVAAGDIKACSVDVSEDRVYDGYPLKDFLREKKFNGKGK